MPDQINTAYVRQFADNFKITAQQMETEIRSFVTVETNIKDKKYIDYVGEVGEPQIQVSLVQKKVFQEVPHTRRVCLTWPYNLPVPLPKAADLRILADPLNPYQRVIKASFMRFVEKKIFLAVIGTSIAVTTEDFTESFITLPVTQKVVEGGTVGCTSVKIREALTRFNLNNRQDSEKVLWLSPRAINDMMEDLEVTRSEKEVLAMLRGGKVSDILWGFTVRMSNQLPKTGNIRSCIAYCKEGVALGLNDEFNAQINPRYEYINLREIDGNMDFGATRLQETDVFEIQCYEAS